jgi:hypothetical protein
MASTTLRIDSLGEAARWKVMRGERTNIEPT